MALNVFIKSLREKHGLSQEYVGAKLGITRQTYLQIENGKRDITITEAKKFAQLYGLSLNSFINEQEDKSMRVELEKPGPVKKEEDIRIVVPRARVEKFREVLIYLLEKVGALPHIGETVIYKLLYFMDFDYYEKYEENLIGAKYIKNKFGPTPVEFTKIVEDMVKKGEVERIKSKFHKYEQKKYLPLRPARLEKFNGRELDHINEVISRLAGKNAAELSEYSHQDVPWIMAAEGKQLDYEAVFYRTPKTSVRNYEDDTV